MREFIEHTVDGAIPTQSCRKVYATDYEGNYLSDVMHAFRSILVQLSLKTS